MERTIILAMDASDGAKAALPVAEQIARRDRAHLVVAHAQTHAIETRLQAELEAKVEELCDSGVDAELVFRTELAGHEANMLAALADERHAEMIVIAGRGRSPLSGAMMGSVTQRLLHVAGCQVLVVPAPVSLPAGS
ncbi:MAG TPA: universal stress protein [Gaiellales bacterium]|nr:universal stress protein [Gaiellales bacterium]